MQDTQSTRFEGSASFGAAAFLGGSLFFVISAVLSGTGFLGLGGGTLLGMSDLSEKRAFFRISAFLGGEARLTGERLLS